MVKRPIAGIAKRPVLGRTVAGRGTHGKTEDPIDPEFDEAIYLRAFPDVADAVRRGSLDSGLAHFVLAGRSEGRLEKPVYRALRGSSTGLATSQVFVDSLTISTSGSTLMTGWSDDRLDQLTNISLQTRSEVRHTWAAFPRLARADVERSLDSGSGRPLGFLLIAAPTAIGDTPAIDMRDVKPPAFQFASGTEMIVRCEPIVTSDADLRDLALATLPAATEDERDPEEIYRILDQHVGVQIAAINRIIVERARSRCVVTRVGAARDRYLASVIVMLRGGADQIAIRSALVAAVPGADEYEFIYVVTDPNQFEPALRAARIAELTLGISHTLVFQPDGDSAGFGEDAAAAIARSDRLLFMDCAVFPRDRDWALRHSAILAEAPETRTRLFGGLLFQADCSLAQGGYYFDEDTSVILGADGAPHLRNGIRLQRSSHPAPSLARYPLESRPVVGVPGAFMSVDRAWFDRLGGFIRHYSRAALEDIDLCLRALKQGFPAWIHPLPMWHFARWRPARAEPNRGGMILNDWLFHRQWDATIAPDLLGPDPSLPEAMDPPAANGSDSGRRARSSAAVV